MFPRLNPEAPTMPEVFGLAEGKDKDLLAFIVGAIAVGLRPGEIINLALRSRYYNTREKLYIIFLMGAIRAIDELGGGGDLEMPAVPSTN